MSVIVPVHNGRMQLSRCLEGLQQSSYRDFELLVVDDCSTDNTPEIVERYGVRYLRTPSNMGPGGARNLGVEQAAADIVVFVDADVVVAPDALQRIYDDFARDPELAAVFGSYDDAPAWPDFVSQYKNLSHHYYHQIASEQAETFWAGCGAVRKHIFQQFGGFNAKKYRRPSVEDIELGFRITRSGLRIRLDKKVLAQHLKRWSLSGMLRADILCRAVPWTQLILETKHVPKDLNLRTSSRLSGVLVGLLVVAIAVLPVSLAFAKPATLTWYLLPVLAGLMALLLALNWHMYGWFAKRRGLAFAAGAVVLHWLYYFYSSLAFGICMLAHQLREFFPQQTTLPIRSNGQD
ncbi:MAG: glycosyltransferase [Acidobacteriia bacterium]|nr:glycosyltransferase [Terriglobia bacterium]